MSQNFPDHIKKRTSRIFAEFQYQLNHLLKYSGEDKRSLLEKGIISPQQYIHAFNFKARYSGNATLGLMVLAADALGYDLEIVFHKQGENPKMGGTQIQISYKDDKALALALKDILLSAIEKLRSLGKIYQNPVAEIFAQDTHRAMTAAEKSFRQQNTQDA